MPPDFNPSYQVPNWGWWIVLYFYLGGVTGGIYFAAAWLDLFGDLQDRAAMRLGHLLAFPLIIVCAVFLVVDLGQPLRFWHMIFQSERFPQLVLKAYSPMSLGSGILGLAGLVSFFSFADEVLARGRWFHRPGNPLGKVLSAVGAVAGLALAGYTGSLLTVSNEPVWGDSPWLSALFLFSGVSTALALLLLLPRVPRTTHEKLSEADNYLMLFELITLIVFLVTLGAVGRRFVFGSPTFILFAIVAVVGILLPLVLHWRPSLAGGLRTASILASLLALVGGFVLRWAALAGPQGLGL